jgi:hypothetical protein
MLAVPEPATWLLTCAIAIGLLGFGAVRSRSL